MDMDVRKAADLARIQLTDDEAARFGRQLGKIVEYIDKLATLNVDGVEATAHTSAVYDVMRPDVSRPGFGLDKALLNAPRKTADQFLVTKVVE